MRELIKQLSAIAVIAAIAWFGYQKDWSDKIMEAADSAGEKIGNSTGNEHADAPHWDKYFKDPGDNPQRPYADYNNKALEVLDNNVHDFQEDPGYKRNKFFIHSGTWNKVSMQESLDAGWKDFPNKKCSVRNAVLIEQGKNVKYTKGCKITSGVFEDRYGEKSKSGKITYAKSTNKGDFDIDHVVALSLGWRSGMSQAEESLRNMFANDKANLVISDKSLNRSKGDQSIDEWFPPQGSKYHCDYADRYAYIKAKYGITITQDELNTLKGQLDKCNA